MSKKEFTPLDESILLYLKDGLATDMELFERFFYGASDFTAEEFERQKKSERGLLDAIISAGGYGLQAIGTKPSIIDLLNEMLKVTWLHDKVRATKPDLPWTEVMEKLQKQTKKYRKRPFEDLKEDEKMAIKRLNRLTLERAHPKEAPFIGFSDFTLEEFLSQRKDERKLYKAIIAELNAYVIADAFQYMDWLNNQFLPLTYLHENISAMKPDLVWTEEIKTLREQTRKDWGKTSKDLTDDEKKAIKRLNRLSIELAHPNETPLGGADFSLDEFESQGKDIRKLCEGIRDGGYELEQVSAPELSVDWLNEILQQTSLYNAIRTRKPDLPWTKEIKALRIQTDKDRRRPFEDLTGAEKMAIKRLNRLTIELAHPDETPVITFSSDFSVDEFKSQRKKILKLCEAVRSELYMEVGTRNVSESSEYIISLLNSLLLQSPSLHKRVATRRPDLPWTQEIKELQKETGKNSGKAFKDLTDYEKKQIMRLNRMTIELAHPHETPKSFFYRGAQDIETRLRVKRSKLPEMKEDGLIDIAEYPHEPSIVVITQVGASMLADKYQDLDIDTMWMHLPRQGHVAHDMFTVRVARKSLREVKGASIFFEPFLKQEMAMDKNKSGKGWGVPDFRLEIRMDNTSEKKCCNFEIVEGGITRKDLLGKVTSSRHDLFILAKTAKKRSFCGMRYSLC